MPVGDDTARLQKWGGRISACTPK